jgi:hypothetical protein
MAKWLKVENCAECPTECKIYFNWLISTPSLKENYYKGILPGCPLKNSWEVNDEQ